MFCPIMKLECIKEECKWWSETYENSCAINAIELHLGELNSKTGVAEE